jgi:Peptidase family M28
MARPSISAIASVCGVALGLSCTPSGGQRGAPPVRSLAEHRATAPSLTPPSPSEAPVAALPVAAPSAAGAPVIGASVAPVPSCVDQGDPFDPAELEQHVAVLAAPELDGRAAGSAGDVAARQAVVETFRCLGLAAGGDDGQYEQRFVFTASSADAASGQVAEVETANVVGYLAGTDASVSAEIIVVGAHLDHLGGGLLGANDNASGVVAMLSVARALARRGAARRTVAFVAFGGEEQGLLGSQYWVQHPPAALPLDHVVQMINLDMVGSYSSRKRVYAFGAFAGMEATRLLRKLDDSVRHTRVAIGGHSVRGDQLGFCQQGIPYVFFWTPDAKCYHAACDTADRLDSSHMADITQLASALVQALADAKADLLKARQRIGCGAR